MQCTKQSFIMVVSDPINQAFIFKESESYHSPMLSLTAS